MMCTEVNCVKKFCESLKECSLKMRNFEKKKTVPLTNEQGKLYEKTKICCIDQKKFEHKYNNDRDFL